MVANALSATYDHIQKIVALELGWRRDPSSWTAENDSDFELIVDQGLRQFYYPDILPGEQSQHNWSFLYPLAEIELTAVHTTGKIDNIAAGVVTGIDTAFPSWTAQGDLWIVDDEQTRRYTIDASKSVTATSFTLNDLNASISTPADLTYSLRRHYYDLPDDFGGMASDGFVYRRDEYRGQVVRQVGEATLRSMDHEYNTALYPEVFALVPVVPTASQSSRWQVIFQPLAQETMFLEYRYNAIPPTLTGGAHIYHYGGAEHSEAVISSVVDKAHQVINNSYEKHEAFLAALRRSVARDRRNYNEKSLGSSVMTDGAHSNGLHETISDFRSSIAPGDITYTFG